MSGDREEGSAPRQWGMNRKSAGGEGSGGDGESAERGKGKADRGTLGPPSTVEMEAMLARQTDILVRSQGELKAGLENGVKVALGRSERGAGGGLKAIEAGIASLAKDLKDAQGEAGAESGAEEVRAAAAAVFAEFDGRVRTLQEDFARAAKARRRSGQAAGILAVTLLLPVCFGLGLAAQHQLALQPQAEEAVQADETGGWRSYVWERYGEAIIECEREAENRGAALVCELAVDQ